MRLLGRVRSALTGRYVTREDAAASPETTVVERGDPARPAARALLAAYDADDTGDTTQLAPQFEALRQALNG